MTVLKLRKIGNSIGVVLPADMLGHLHAGLGDVVHVTPANGGLRLTSYDPAFEKQMAAMKTVMRKSRNALRALAKQVQEPEWITKSVVLALHEQQLAEHGGHPGVRDEAMLDSALDRPKNQFACGAPDIFDLAAAYAFGVARNHLFLDGNRRASLVASEGFLLINGSEVTASEAAKVSLWLALAAGTTSEAQVADWFRTNSTPTDQIARIDNLTRDQVWRP